MTEGLSALQVIAWCMSR